MADTTKIGEIKLNTEQAQKAIDDLTKTLKNLNVQFKETEKNAPNFKTAQAGVNSLNTSFLKLAGSFGLATTGAEIFMEAIHKAVDFMKESVKLAAEEEQARTRLMFALDGNKKSYESLVAWKEKLRKTTTYTREEIDNVVNMGLSLGRTTIQTEQMTKTAMGLSKVTGMDLQTIMMQLNATYEGQLGRLTRLDGSLKQLTKSQLANGEAIDVLNGKYGKYATTGLNTVNGQITQMKKEIDELQKELGEKLLPVIRDVLKAFSQLFMSKEEKGWKMVEGAIVSLQERKKELAGNNDKWAQDEIKNLDKLIAKYKEDLRIHGQRSQIKDIQEENKLMIATKLLSVDVIDKRVEEIKQEKKTLEVKKQKKQITDEEYKSQLKSLEATEKAYKNLFRFQGNEPPAAPGKEKTDINAKQEKSQQEYKDFIEKNNKEILKIQQDYTKAEMNTLLTANAEKIKVEEANTKPNLDNLKAYFEARIQLIETATQAELGLEQKSYEQKLKDADNEAEKEKEKLIQEQKEIEKIRTKEGTGVSKSKQIKEKQDLDAKILEIDKQTAKKKEELGVETQSNLKQISEKGAKDQQDVDLQLQADIKKNREQNQKEIIEGYQKTFDEVKALMDKPNIGSGKDIDELKRKLLELKATAQEQFNSGLIDQKSFDEMNKNADAALKELKGKMRATAEDIKGLASEILGSISGLISQINTNSQQEMDNTLTNLDQAYQAEYTQLDNLLAKKVITQKQYDAKVLALQKEQTKKENEIKREQAKKQREADILQAIISTAIGVIQATNTAPPLDIILPIIVGAMGLAQIALIASKPLPAYGKGGRVPKKYADGGVINGPSHDMGGVPLIAEGGEHIFSRQKTQQFSPLFNQIQNNQPGQPIVATVDHQAIANAVVSSINRIPVTVSEYDITRTQKKVSTIESNASWNKK